MCHSIGTSLAVPVACHRAAQDRQDGRPSPQQLGRIGCVLEIARLGVWVEEQGKGVEVGPSVDPVTHDGHSAEEFDVFPRHAPETVSGRKKLPGRP